MTIVEQVSLWVIAIRSNHAQNDLEQDNTMRLAFLIMRLRIYLNDTQAHSDYSKERVHKSDRIGLCDPFPV